MLKNVSCSKLHDLEAELCKVQSKYVILLKESQEPELGKSDRASARARVRARSSRN